jgi:hypothetical protein
MNRFSKYFVAVAAFVFASSVAFAQSLLLLGAGASGAAPPSIRIVIDTANSFYAVVNTTTSGVILCHHFIRNNNGDSSTPPGSVGSPFQPWRYVGTSVLPTFASAPADATYTYSSDVGAQDYAFSANGLFAGSYHGGETVTAETLKMDGVAFNPMTDAPIGTQLVVTHDSSIVNSSNTVTVTGFSETASTDGTIAFNAPSISSSQSYTTTYIGMGIFSHLADSASVAPTDGASRLSVPIAALSYTYLLTSPDVQIRDSSSGRTMRWHSTSAPGRRFVIVRDDVRTKIYFEQANGTLGTKAFAWTVSFGTDATSPSFNANLLTNADFATSLTGWATPIASGSIAWNAASGGVARFTRSASGENRMMQGVSTTVGAYYLVGFNYSAVNGASLAATSNSNGSTSSPAPAFAATPVPNAGGFYALFLGTQTTTYAMALQTLGTAGQTFDVDNAVLQLIQ